MNESPFHGLSSDFPAVMGDGLDFDPLTYSLNNVSSQDKHGMY